MLHQQLYLGLKIRKYFEAAGTMHPAPPPTTDLHTARCPATGFENTTILLSVVVAASLSRDVAAAQLGTDVLRADTRHHRLARRALCRARLPSCPPRVHSPIRALPAQQRACPACRQPH